LFSLLIFVGAVAKLNLVWLISDIFNALMAVPNLLGLLLLSGLVAGQTRDYLGRLRAGEFER
jgi:AGCS family alanine or glycine:cation symporter